MNGSSFADWCFSTLRLRRGKPWITDGFRGALWRCPIEQFHNTAIQKAVQLGVSTWACARTIYFCLQGYDVIYVLPSERKCQKFVYEKLSPLLASLNLPPQLPNSVFCRRIGDGLLHLSGCSRDSQATAESCDILILDDYTALDPNVRTTFRERLEASELGLVIMISRPAASDKQFDGHIQRGRCYTWHVVCRSCDKVIALDPRCWEKILDVPHFKTFVCPECAKPLDPNDINAKETRRAGKFKALNPRAKFATILLSAIHDHLRPIEWFNYKFIEYQKDAFVQAIIGIAPAEGVLEAEELITAASLVSSRPPIKRGSHEDFCSIGIDVSIGRYYWLALMTGDDSFAVVNGGIAKSAAELQMAIEPLLPRVIVYDQFPPDIELENRLANFAIDGNALVMHCRMIGGAAASFFAEGEDYRIERDGSIIADGLRTLQMVKRIAPKIVLHDFPHAPILARQLAGARIDEPRVGTWKASIPGGGHWFDALRFAVIGASAAEMTNLGAQDDGFEQEITGTTAYSKTRMTPDLYVSLWRRRAYV